MLSLFSRKEKWNDFRFHSFREVKVKFKCLEIEIERWNCKIILEERDSRRLLSSISLISQGLAAGLQLLLLASRTMQRESHFAPCNPLWTINSNRLHWNKNCRLYKPSAPIAVKQKWNCILQTTPAQKSLWTINYTFSLQLTTPVQKSLWITQCTECSATNQLVLVTHYCAQVKCTYSGYNALNCRV